MSTAARSSWVRRKRADVIVDFSQHAGQTLILYNDAPTAFPALVPQYDYYTGAPDRRDIGGANTILPGKGPNIRTVMQIKVAGAGGAAPLNYYNPATLSALDNAFKSLAGLPGAFALEQEPIIVGQTAYNAAYGHDVPRDMAELGHREDQRYLHQLPAGGQYHREQFRDEGERRA